MGQPVSQAGVTEKDPAHRRQRCSKTWTKQHGVKRFQHILLIQCTRLMPVLRGIYNAILPLRYNTILR